MDPKKKILKVVSETFDEGTSPGTYGQLRDRVTVESFGMDLPEVIDSRKALIGAQVALNEGDVE